MSSSRRRSKGDEDDYYSRGSRRSSGGSRHRRERSRSRSLSSSRDSYHERRSDHDERRHRRHDGHRDDSDRRGRRSRSRSRDRDEGHRNTGSSRRDERSAESGDNPDNGKEPARVPEPILTDVAGISIKLSVTSQPFKPAAAAVPKVLSTPLIRSTTVASIFNDDEDEHEEMPPEAKMKMKNVGRNTPTSAGPNSFGKTKIGFCNAIHIAERDLEEKQMGNK